MQDVQMKSLSPENEDSVHGHLLFKQPLPAVLRYGINILNEKKYKKYVKSEVHEHVIVTF